MPQLLKPEENSSSTLPMSASVMRNASTVSLALEDTFVMVCAPAGTFSYWGSSV